MTEVPEIFQVAAAWAEGRPFGDAAGIAVRELLAELTGPPRIGVCTVDAPITVVVPGATMVHAAWPAVGSGADVVLLIHPGPVPGRVRSRMRIGPQKFVHIVNKEQAEKFQIGISQLTMIREQLLGCELRALAMRFPEVTGLIPQAVGRKAREPRVVVIGPDPTRVSALSSELARHVTVVDSADADVVVAVPGGQGFMLIHAPTIQDAWQRVGRLVTLSPLPIGMCAEAVPAGRDLVATINLLAAQPAQITTPPVPAGKWLQAMARIDSRQRNDAIRLRRDGDRNGMRELARRCGITLPPDPRFSTRDLLIVAGIILGACLIRPEFLPVVLGMIGLRLGQQRHRALCRWWEDAQMGISLDTTSTTTMVGKGPREWLREMVRDNEGTR